MPEKLLSVDEAAARLGISRREFYRRRTKLIACGLQERLIGSTRKYREASLDQMIAANDEAVAVITRDDEAVVKVA